MATEALDPVTGKLLWTARTGGMNASGRPLYGGGLIFINNGMGSLGAVPAEGDAVRDAKWSTRRNIPKKGSMLLKGEHLYMVADNGVASCLVAATGEALWSERLNAGEFAASPILCQDRIYCFSLSGKCVVLAASPKNSRCWLAANLRMASWLLPPSPATPLFYAQNRRLPRGIIRLNTRSK